MSLLLVTSIVIGIFLSGYWIYGRFLASAFRLRRENLTPAVQINDGIDFTPTHPTILLGQHFTAIAAVGPIVGPILAGSQHGWLPGLLWIAMGSLFIGGVHDFSALVSSLRHGARSIAELVKLYISPTGYLFFLLFIWLSLLYVVVVFTDLTSQAFVAEPLGPGVASSSFLYLLLAVLLGVALYRLGISLWLSTLLFVPMVFAIIWMGQKIPVSLPPLFGSSQRAWYLIILLYCFIASVIPLKVLLQPRGYLGSFYLLSTFVVGFIGTLLGGVLIKYPARVSTLLFGTSLTEGTPTPVIFPLLFTTIACGACSGFHGLVSSGTTSKMLRSESEARRVGYGGMLLEGFVAVIALSTVMMLAPGDPGLKRSPDEIYAFGLARFLEIFGVPLTFAVTFGKLAFATFIYDTLDVATRLGRYIFQELTGWKGRWGAIAATLATLILPTFAVFYQIKDPTGKIIPLWKIFWPLFGTSNQLLAAITLTAVTVWLKREGNKWWITGIPALFMVTITFWSLILIISPWLSRLLGGGFQLDWIGTTGTLLFLLALLILIQGVKKIIFLRTHEGTL